MDYSKVKIIQEKLIETLEAFDNFCSKHKIKYSIAAGTALGAVRHGGIIPWDDDVDVCMLQFRFQVL